MIDTSPWKTDDPEWVKKRNELWHLYETWFNNNERSSDAIPEEQMRRAKDYYDCGKVEGDYRDRLSALSYSTLLMFHPNLTEDAVRQIVDYLESVGIGGLKGSIHCFAQAGMFDLFIKANLVSPDVTHIIPHAMLGDSYEEAAKNMGFDPSVATIDSMDKLVMDFAMFIAGRKNPLYYPAKMLIPHFIRMLEIGGVSLWRERNYYTKRLIKRLNRFDPNDSDISPQQAEFVPLLRSAIKNSNITPEIKDAIEDK